MIAVAKYCCYSSVDGTDVMSEPWSRFRFWSDHGMVVFLVFLDLEMFCARPNAHVRFLWRKMSDVRSCHKDDMSDEEARR